MKTYKAIYNDIQKTTAKYDELSKAIHEERDHDKTAELCAEQEKARLVKEIQRGNFRYTLGLAGLEALKEITKKYDGKPCGEVTNKTICKEMRKRGFCFYFGGRYSFDKACYSASITMISGFGYGHGEEATIYGDFITKENKIDYSAIEGAKIGGSYCDNIPKRVREIQKAYKKYADAVAVASEAQNTINALLPDTLANFNNVNKYLHGYNGR